MIYTSWHSSFGFVGVSVVMLLRTFFWLSVRLMIWFAGFVTRLLGLGLTEVEQLANLLEVGLVDKRHVVQIALLFLRLLRENVTVIRMISFYFPCSGKRKALFGTGIRLYFWHFCFV